MEVKRLLKEDKPLIFLYVVSTLYFLYQYNTSTLWDFSAYILNAKYLFYGGSYFEVFRAPLVPLFLGIFLLVGNIGINLYIIAVSTFFFYSTFKFSGEILKNLEEKNKKIARMLFYFFILSNFVLSYGLIGGTELLGLAFLEFFLYSLLTGKISGHWLGLAILTRYNFLYFIPLLLFHKKPREILKNLLITTAILFPWLLFNYIKYGNWFTSIIDSYALNIYFRQNISEPLTFSHFLGLIEWFWPFLIIGLVFCIIQIVKRQLTKNKLNVLMILTIVVIIYDFCSTPFKIERYLFNLALPIAFFSANGALFLMSKIRENKKAVISFVLIIFFITATILAYNGYIEKPYKDKFFAAAKDIERLELSQCEIISPQWVIVAYYTDNIYPPEKNDSFYFNKSITNNKTLLFFKRGELDEESGFDLTSLKGIPVLYETENYIFLAKQDISQVCSPKYIYDDPIASDPCQIVYKKIGDLGFNFCRAINKKPTT